MKTTRLRPCHNSLGNTLFQKCGGFYLKAKFQINAKMLLRRMCNMNRIVTGQCREKASLPGTGRGEKLTALIPYMQDQPSKSVCPKNI